MSRTRSVLVVSNVPLERCPPAQWFQRHGWRVVMAGSEARAEQITRGVRIDLVVHHSPRAEVLDPDLLTVIRAEKRLRAVLRESLERLQVLRDTLDVATDEGRHAFEQEFSRYLQLASRSRQRVRKLGAQLFDGDPSTEAALGCAH